MDMLSTIFCIPNRLSEDPEDVWHNFPLNIVLMRLSKYQGELAIFTFEYKPELDNARDDLMMYCNVDDDRHFIIYSYELKTDKYQAEKFFNEQSKGVAQGRANWDLFFRQVSLLSPVVGEPCKIDLIADKA